MTLTDFGGLLKTVENDVLAEVSSPSIAGTMKLYADFGQLITATQEGVTGFEGGVPTEVAETVHRIQAHITTHRMSPKALGDGKLLGVLNGVLQFVSTNLPMILQIIAALPK